MKPIISDGVTRFPGNGHFPRRSATVPADGSQAIRVTLTMADPQGADIRFVARDIASKTVLSAVDRFVVP